MGVRPDRISATFIIGAVLAALEWRDVRVQLRHSAAHHGFCLTEGVFTAAVFGGIGLWAVLGGFCWV
jgi:hypothetical protein